MGLEPFAQGYIDPVRAYFAGLAAVGRYHFLSLGRFVPYVELAGAAGGTTLRVREIDSAFTFLIFGGVGASYFRNVNAESISRTDRKSTRLNSSHLVISYAVFCLKKK